MSLTIREKARDLPVRDRYDVTLMQLEAVLFHRRSDGIGNYFDNIVALTDDGGAYTS